MQSVDVARHRGVEDHHPLGPLAGGESRFSADSQPVAWRQPNSYSARRMTEVLVSGDRLEQNLLDRALERAQRQALLEQAVGALLVERGERGAEPA